MLIKSTKIKGERKLLKGIVSEVILLSLLISVRSTQASSPFNITIETSKLCYNIEESIKVHGNLTYNGWPVQQVLIALEVVDPDYNLVFLNTLETDTFGAYNTTFKLPPAAKLGTYIAYVSIHVEESVTNSTTFKLVILGDVNGDGKVDLKDVYTVAKAHGSFPGHPEWNPNCDINDDEKIDLKDYYATCLKFGKTDP
jgi:hypothetical protein